MGLNSMIYTTEKDFEDHLEKAQQAIRETQLYRTSNPEYIDNWMNDALTNHWVEGISIEEWVQRAMRGG